MTVLRNVCLWFTMFVIGYVLVAQPAAAGESDRPLQAPKEEEILQLFETAYGPEAGRARYDQWRATKDLPLDDYLKTGTSPPVADTPQTSIANPPPSPAVVALPVPPPAPAVQRSARPQYRLTDGDVLRIAVWQWPDLRDDDVVVRPDGNISFPLVGEVDALGSTLDDLDTRLTTALKLYIRNPQVSVSMRRFGGRKIVVLGQVRAPGVYVLGYQAGSGNYTSLQQGTLIEALALAGGFAPGAQRKRVIILRGGFEHPQILRVDINRTLTGKDATFASNIQVQGDDIIYVPATRLTKIVDDIDPLIKIINTAFQTYVGTTTLQQSKNSSN